MCSSASFFTLTNGGDCRNRALGYLYVGIFSGTNLLLALILFFGSVFVAIVITLLDHLMETARTRSIDISEVLIGVIDARDPNLNGHSLSVQNLTMVLYRRLPSNLRSQINPVSLEYAALMHDVGKLGVPEAILNKPGKLDKELVDIFLTIPKEELQKCLPEEVKY